MKITDIKAMDTVQVNVIINSFRTQYDPRSSHGNVVTRVRQLVASGAIHEDDAVDNGVRPLPTMVVLSLTKEAVQAVLLSYEAYGTADAVRAFLPPAAPVAQYILSVGDTDGVKTMSSLDMVTFINSTRKQGEPVLRHDHFMAKVPNVLKDAPKFRGIYFDSMKRQQDCYNFPEQESMFMAMSFSTELQQTVYRAWKAAEAKVAPPLAFGIPTTYLDALKQLVSSVELTTKQSEQIAQQAVQIETAAPAVAFVDKYVESTGRRTFREVAKLLSAPEREFRNFLMDHKYMHMVNGSYVPSQIHAKAGRFETKESVVDSVARSQCYFTPKGVEYIAKKWNERVPMLYKAVNPVTDFSKYQ